jgi:hypothetical protein
MYCVRWCTAGRLWRPAAPGTRTCRSLDTAPPRWQGGPSDKRTAPPPCRCPCLQRGVGTARGERTGQSGRRQMKSGALSRERGAGSRGLGVPLPGLAAAAAGAPQPMLAPSAAAGGGGTTPPGGRRAHQRRWLPPPSRSHPLTSRSGSAGRRWGVRSGVSARTEQVHRAGAAQARGNGLRRVHQGTPSSA